MKYILFDLDGTLTDPKIGITKSVAYSLEKFGINVENLDDLDKFIGPPLKVSYMDFYNFTEEKALEATAYYRERYSVTGLYENYLYDGITDLLETLKSSGKTLIVATSKPRVFAEKILDHFNISQYFTDICGCEFDGTRSAKGEVIQYALSQNGVKNKSDVIMVGDRKHDVIGARENDIKCIGVLYGYGDMKEMQEHNADFIVKDIKDLKNLLQNL